MDPDRLNDTVNNLVNGTATSTPWLTLICAALVAGFLLTVTPKALRLLTFAYIALMAVCIYVHRMDFVYMGMVGGLVVGALLYPFRPKAKA